MTDDVRLQADALVTPGALFKAAREQQGMPEAEAAERLNWMPGYVAIVERDAYEELASPAFARGYVKAYGKLLGLDQEQLLSAFDRLQEIDQDQRRKRVQTRPLQMQPTGVGVVVGLAILLLLVLALWWSRGEQPEAGPAPAAPAIVPAEIPPAGES